MTTELIEAAQQALKQAEFAEASVLYEKVLSQETNNTIALIGLGHAKIYTGHLIQAIDALHKALELEPNNAEAYFLLGNANYWQKEYQEAEEYQRKAVILAPSVAKYRLGLAADLDKLGESELALTQLEIAYQLDPQILNPHGRWKLWRARILTGLRPVSWLTGWVFIGTLLAVGGAYGLNKMLDRIGHYIPFVSIRQNQILLRALLTSIPFIATCVYQLRKQRYRRMVWAFALWILWGLIVWYIPHRAGFW